MIQIPVANDDSTSYDHQIEVPEVKYQAYVYCTFIPHATNPIPNINGQTTGIQIVTVGLLEGDDFSPVARFGMINDTHSPFDEYTNLLPWAQDGKFNYYSAYARPKTPYDFKVHLNLKQEKMTVWCSGRGDEDWFMLAENVPLINKTDHINAIQVKQSIGGTGVEDLVVESEILQDREMVRSHPLAKKKRVVDSAKGFHFQQMRSAWRRPGRHVTVTRRNPQDSLPWIGFPDVVESKPGSLVATFSDGDTHGAGGRLLVVHSNDTGRTWGNEIAIKYPDGEDVTGLNCPRIQKLKNGSLLLLADLRGGAKTLFFRSLDEGYTWDQYSHLSSNDSDEGKMLIVPSRVLELADDTWLIGLTNIPGRSAWNMTESTFIEIYSSRDKGKNWELLSEIKDPSNVRSWFEPDMIQLENGRIWLFAREAHRLLPGLKTSSDDNGRTWSEADELPLPVIGRPCAGLLPGNRAMVTFRVLAGRQGLWAWTGDPAEKTTARIVGIHFQDKYSVGLKDGQLHIDSDALCGQFTRYCLRSPDSPASVIDVSAEIMVTENHGRAATLSVPFVGKLRIFTDYAEMAHEPSLRADVTEGEFHTYRILYEPPGFTLYIDGKKVFTSDKNAHQVVRTDWSAVGSSPFIFAFGNEPAFSETSPWEPVSEVRAGLTSSSWLKTYHDNSSEPDTVIPEGTHMLGMAVMSDRITPAVTGHSIWKSLDVQMQDPNTGRNYSLSWSAEQDGFPDQYILDRVIEVESSISGLDNGYSGWITLSDGRIFVINYTDDIAPACPAALQAARNLPWIRGTYLNMADVLPVNP